MSTIIYGVAQLYESYGVAYIVVVVVESSVRTLVVETIVVDSIVVVESHCVRRLVVEQH